MKLYCIGDELTVRAFRLAGIDGAVVSTPAEAPAALNTALTEPDHALVILTSAVAEGITAQIEQIRLTRDRPLVVQIPELEGPLPEIVLGGLVQAVAGVRVS